MPRWQKGVGPRRNIFGRGYRHRIGTEFRGAAVQDGAVAAIVRSLHRSLRGTAGIPARQRHRGGMKKGFAFAHLPLSWSGFTGRSSVPETKIELPGCSVLVLCKDLLRRLR